MQWDPTGSTTTGTAQDGNGVWSTSSTNNYWYNGSTSGNAWSNGTGDTANFGSISTSKSFTVTVSGTVNVGTINLNATSNTVGISLSGGTINGPSGGTLLITDTNGSFFTQNSIAGVNFTGASNVQFIAYTAGAGAGYVINGNTRDRIDG